MQVYHSIHLEKANTIVPTNVFFTSTRWKAIGTRNAVFVENTVICSFHDSWNLKIDLSSNLMVNVSNQRHWLYTVFLFPLLQHIEDYLQKCSFLENFYILHHDNFHFGMIKIDLFCACRPYLGLSTAVYSLSLRCLVPEIMGTLGVSSTPSRSRFTPTPVTTSGNHFSYLQNFFLIALLFMQL